MQNIGKVLLSSSSPFQQEFAANISADIFDQEAFQLCTWSRKQNIPFFSYKLISDFGEKDLTHVKQNAHQASQALFQFYKKLSLN